MNDNLPSPIKSGDDLAKYEAYAELVRCANRGMSNNITVQDNFSYIPSDNKNLPEVLSNTAFMPAFLSKHIGKLVKIEALLGNQLHERIGILMTVGAGFIVLRFKNNATLVCDLDSIRFVTIIHDNNFKGLMSNY